MRAKPSVYNEGLRFAEALRVWFARIEEDILALEGRIKALERTALLGRQGLTGQTRRSLKAGWHPFGSQIEVSISLRKGFRWVPACWGQWEYIIIRKYPEGGAVISEWWWHWLFVHLTVKPRLISQADM